MRSNSKTASHPLVELFTQLTLSALVPCVNPEKTEERKNSGTFSGVMENNAETFSSLASQSVFRNTSSSLQTGGGRNTAETFCTRTRKQTSSFPLCLSTSFPSWLERGNMIINKLKKALYTVFQLSAPEHISEKEERRSCATGFF